MPELDPVWICGAVLINLVGFGMGWVACRLSLRAEARRFSERVEQELIAKQVTERFSQEAPRRSGQEVHT
jgi:hypothetical protein